MHRAGVSVLAKKSNLVELHVAPIITEKISKKQKAHRNNHCCETLLSELIICIFI